jgi:IS30 family transposase
MHNHLTAQERDLLAQLRRQGGNQQEIARAMARSPSTISRELQRNSTNGEYQAAQAQRQAERRRRERPLRRKLDEPELNAFVRQGLGQEWSPEQISGRAKEQYPDDPRRQASAQTIYTWIDQDEDRKYWKARLRRRGRRPYRPRKKPPNPEKARIDQRPEEIEGRLRLGDFEGDTVLGPPGTGGLATLVCRKSRYTIVVKIQSKDADHVHRKIRDRLKELREEQRCSVTFDNGTEFARCHRLEKHLDMKLYFAQPGCPFQRGSNENTNGLIRQYFPKGTDFRTVTHREVRDVEKLLNNRPRACLNFRTPAEEFQATS